VTAEATKDWRSLSGAIGIYVSLVGFVIGVMILLLLLDSSRNPGLDSLFTHFGKFFRKVFILVLCSSGITLFLSCLGRGQKRAFGLAFSVVNFLLCISVLGAGE
jgi:hypothetical protein